MIFIISGKAPALASEGGPGEGMGAEELPDS